MRLENQSSNSKSKSTLELKTQSLDQEQKMASVKNFNKKTVKKREKSESTKAIARMHKQL